MCKKEGLSPPSSTSGLIVDWVARYCRAVLFTEVPDMFAGSAVAQVVQLSEVSSEGTGQVRLAVNRHTERTVVAAAHRCILELEPMGLEKSITLFNVSFVHVVLLINDNILL